MEITPQSQKASIRIATRFNGQLLEQWRGSAEHQEFVGFPESVTTWKVFKQSQIRKLKLYVTDASKRPMAIRGE